MKKPIGIPSMAKVTMEVHAYGRELKGYDPADITEHGCDEPGGDIRLRVHAGSWFVYTGSSDYDQDHRGYWGSGWVPAGCTKSEARRITRDLIDQVREDYAMSLPS